MTTEGAKAAVTLLRFVRSREAREESTDGSGKLAFTRARNKDVVLASHQIYRVSPALDIRDCELARPSREPSGEEQRSADQVPQESRA